MTKIKNYDSRSSISTYELGDVCSFYLHGGSLARLEQMDGQALAKYSKKLDKAIKDSAGQVGGDGKYCKFVRAIGVVVDKYQTIKEQGVDMITVMFKTTDGYVLNKYAVAVENVMTNGKDFVRPAAKLDISVI